MDKDHDGFITPNEVGAVLKALGENVGIVEIKKMLAEVDLNQNGKIEYSEFVQVGFDS